MKQAEHPPAETSAGFIQWCARAYGRPGVRESCLALQDRHGLNVNCLLAAVWAGEQGWALGPRDWTELKAAVATIDDAAVRPVRALRRAISKNPALDPELRAGVKRMLLYAELRAEQAVEAVLYERICAGPHAPGGTPQSNLTAYAGGESPELLHFLALVSESS